MNLTRFVCNYLGRVAACKVFLRFVPNCEALQCCILCLTSLVTVTGSYTKDEWFFSSYIYFFYFRIYIFFASVSETKISPSGVVVILVRC